MSANGASCQYTSLFQASRATMFLDGIREVEFRLNGFSLPDISLGIATQPSALLEIPHPASQMIFGQLPIRFTVDEYLKNYLAIHNWMVALGSPFSRDQYASLGDTVHRDLSIFFYDAMYKKFAEVRFVNAFPTNLGQIDITFEEREPEPVVVSAAFAYERFEITYFEITYSPS